MGGTDQAAYNGNNISVKLFTNVNSSWEKLFDEIAEMTFYGNDVKGNVGTFPGILRFCKSLTKQIKSKIIKHCSSLHCNCQINCLWEIMNRKAKQRKIKGIAVPPRK